MTLMSCSPQLIPIFVKNVCTLIFFFERMDNIRLHFLDQLSTIFNENFIWMIVDVKFFHKNRSHLRVCLYDGLLPIPLFDQFETSLGTPQLSRERRRLANATTKTFNPTPLVISSKPAIAAPSMIYRATISIDFIRPAGGNFQLINLRILLVVLT